MFNIRIYTNCLWEYAYTNNKYKKKEGEKPIQKSAYLTALGGEDNILSHKRIGSRIILCLKDYPLLDKEKLKEAGVIGFIQKSDQLTLVADSDSKKVYETLFNE